MAPERIEHSPVRHQIFAWATTAAVDALITHHYWGDKRGIEADIDRIIGEGESIFTEYTIKTTPERELFEYEFAFISRVVDARGFRASKVSFKDFVAIEEEMKKGNAVILVEVYGEESDEGKGHLRCIEKVDEEIVCDYRAGDIEGVWKHGVYFWGNTTLSADFFPQEKIENFLRLAHEKYSFNAIVVRPKEDPSLKKSA